MSDKSVPEQQYRTLRWWIVVLAVFVLVVNIAIERRAQPMLTAFGWYKHLLRPSSEDDTGGADLVPPLLTSLMLTDPAWRNVVMSIEADRNPTELLAKHKNQPTLSRWIRAQHYHKLLVKRGKLDTQETEEYMRKDPQNALYPLLLANEYFTKAGLDLSKIKTKTWTNIAITHPEELQTAMSYARRVLQAPYLSDYAVEYEDFRTRDITNRYLTEYQLGLTDVRCLDTRYMVIPQREFYKYYGAVMVYLAQHGQLPQAVQMSKSWQSTLFRHESAKFSGEIDILVYQAGLSILSNATAKVAQINGDTQRAKRYSAYIAHMKGMVPPNMAASEEAISKHGSLLASIFCGYQNTSTQQNLEPTRTAEQTFWERILNYHFSTNIACLLVILLLCWAFSSNPNWVYTTKDVVVAAFLAVLPLVVYTILLQFPSIMMREYGAQMLQLFIVQMIVTLTLSVLLPTWWLSYRMRKIAKQPSIGRIIAAIIMLWLAAALSAAFPWMRAVFAVLAFMISKRSANVEWLGQWSRGLVVAMGVLWISLAFITAPLLTAKEAAAWKRDTQIVNSSSVKVFTDQRDRLIRDAAHKYGLLKDAGIK